jgi:predicted nucleic acid-binding protein
LSEYEETATPELVLDTSVAVKFHVPEEHHTEARRLRGRFEEGAVSLLAPGTVLPEVFNAFWQKHRRAELTLEEVWRGWELISELPLALYAPEDLIGRAIEIGFETGVIVYDALFLALAEDAQTVVLTADDRLLKTIRGTAYASLAEPLQRVDSLLR